MDSQPPGDTTGKNRNTLAPRALVSSQLFMFIFSQYRRTIPRILEIRHSATLLTHSHISVPLGRETHNQGNSNRPHLNAVHSRKRTENRPPHNYNSIPAENTPNSVIVWFIFTHFVLLSVSAFS